MFGCVVFTTSLFANINSWSTFHATGTQNVPPVFAMCLVMSEKIIGSTYSSSRIVKHLMQSPDSPPWLLSPLPTPLAYQCTVQTEWLRVSSIIWASCYFKTPLKLCLIGILSSHQVRIQLFIKTLASAPSVPLGGLMVQCLCLLSIKQALAATFFWAEGKTFWMFIFLDQNWSL